MANTFKNTQYDKNNPVFSVQDFVCSGNIYSLRLSKMRKTLMMKKWGRSKRKEVLLKELKSTAETKIRVLGQEHRTEKFTPRHDIETRFQQKEDGLEVSVKRAQRLYNNRRWPNAVVLRLENVEFVGNETKLKNE